MSQIRLWESKTTQNNSLYTWSSTIELSLVVNFVCKTYVVINGKSASPDGGDAFAEIRPDKNLIANYIVIM